jgi:hypothetical protein
MLRPESGISLKPGSAPVDDEAMVERDAAQEKLHAAYQEYRSAMSAWRGAAKAESAETAERYADRLLHARVALYRTLVETGWVPPAAVGVQLDRDVALVDAPQDFDALLGA